MERLSERGWYLDTPSKRVLSDDRVAYRTVHETGESPPRPFAILSMLSFAFILNLLKVADCVIFVGNHESDLSLVYLLQKAPSSASLLLSWMSEGVV